MASGTLLNRTPTLIDGPLSSGDGFMSSRTEYDAASRISFTVEDDVDATENQYYGINRRIKRFDAENNQIEYIYLMLRG